MSAAEQLVYPVRHPFRPYIIEGSAKTEEDRARWKELRRTGIGASEISVVLGCNGWQSIISLFHQKLGTDLGQNDEEETPEYQRWGNLLQHAILTEMTARAGTSLAVEEPLLRSTTYPWALATPDGMTPDGEPIEGKNIAWGFDEDDWNVGIPEKYYLQCQQQILVSDAQRCLFGALIWGQRLLWEWVPRDQRAIDRITLEGERFWDQVRRGVEPLSDGHKDARRILGKLAIVESPVELYESEMGTMLEDYLTAESALKVVRADARSKEKRRDAYMDAIAQHMGRHKQAFTATGWHFRWKDTFRAGYTVEPSTGKKFEITPPR